MGKGTTFALGAAATVALMTAAIGVGRAQFERRVDAEISTLLTVGETTEPHIVSEDDLAGLPDPVQRWLRWARIVGKPYPATVLLKQEGRFRRAEGANWMPFRAEEYFTTDPPGFVWKTMMQMFPLVSIDGRDRYVDGRGSIQMRVLGLIPVADAAGPEIDQGSLLRYLNETMWFPAATLGPYISWEAIDANSARATMSYGGVTASATFFIDDEGKPIDMVAERQDLTHGRREIWSTPISDYGEFAGVRMPVAGQGVWRYEGGDFPYIEVRITELAYDQLSSLERHMSGRSRTQ
jgi:hypothetical protein